MKPSLATIAAEVDVALATIAAVVMAAIADADLSLAGNNKRIVPVSGMISFIPEAALVISITMRRRHPVKEDWYENK